MDDDINERKTKSSARKFSKSRVNAGVREGNNEI